MSSKTANQTVTPGYSSPGMWQFLGPFAEIGEKLKRVFVHTQLDIVGMGVAGTVTTMLILSLALNPAPLVVGLIAFSVYVGDRISDVKREPSSTAERSEFVKEHKKILSVASALAYGIAVAISLTGGPLSLAVTLIPGTAWIVYASDVVDTADLPMSRLKDRLLVNSSLVAFAWTVAMVLLPLSFVNHSVTPLALVLAVYFFLDIFINTEIPNVRDVNEDEKNGVATIPTTVGIPKTRSILYVLNLLLVGLLVLSGVSEIVPFVFVGILVGSRALSLLLNYGVGRVQIYRGLEMAGEMNHVLVLFLVLFLT